MEMYQSLTQLSICQIILLMMFGCKYVSQIMELLGSEVAKEKGIQGLLDKLHDMELVLPD